MVVGRSLGHMKIVKNVFYTLLGSKLRVCVIEIKIQKKKKERYHTSLKIYYLSTRLLFQDGKEVAQNGNCESLLIIYVSDAKRPTPRNI